MTATTTTATVAAATLAAALWAAPAAAAPITGSLGFADGGNETGESLLTRMTFSVTNATTQNSSGDFTAIPANLPVSIGTFTVPVLGGTATSGFTANFVGGTFVATSVQRTDQFVTVTGNESITAYFLGTFTPRDGLAAFQANDASVIANLNRSGSLGNFSVASAFTLAAPPSGSGGGGGTTPVPEPASMALIAMGLVGLGLARRRA